MVRGQGQGDAAESCWSTTGAVVELPGAGIHLMLWDRLAGKWVFESQWMVESGAELSPREVLIRVTENADRYVSDAGTVSLTLTTRCPASDSVSAELAVDLIDGTLVLRPK